MFVNPMQNTSSVINSINQLFTNAELPFPVVATAIQSKLKMKVRKVQVFYWFILNNKKKMHFIW